MPTRRLTWIAIGVASIAIQCLLATLSWKFGHGAPGLDYPVIHLVVLEVLAGGVYLTLIWIVPRSRPERGLLALVLGVGVIMRIVTMASAPILEDDFYRYLWDGAVVTNGLDPYRYSPEAVLGGDAGAELSILAQRSHPVAQRINHPELTTIYPPLAQAVFALAAVVEPFSLTVWRLFLLLFEGATLVLLFLVLVRLKRSPLWLAIYWWNPLVIKELVNSAHMDALLLPALAGVLLLMLLKKRVLACGCLALAAGIKLWPVVLLPVVLRPLWALPRKLAAALAVFAVTFAATAWWLLTQAGRDSGLVAYAGSWNMNDAFFAALDWMVGSTLTALGHDWIDSGGVARAIVAATVVSLALWLNRNAAVDASELCRRFIIITAAVFLLSPTQFPWYYTWLVPFLVVVPSPALLLLTALLPLYYLRFYLDFRGQAGLFDTYIVWLEYLPVWLLLAWQWWLGARRETRTRLVPARL